MTQIDPILQLTQIVLEGQAKQAEAQAKQAEAQAKQAEQINRLEATLVAKLDKIEANTVTIMGMMIQDFDNISPEIHAEIESAAATLEADVETVAFVTAVREDATVTNHRGRTVKARTASGKANATTVMGKDNITTVKECISNLDMETYGDLPHIIPLGNYVSSLFTKAFGVQFGGKYPIRFAPLIESFINYYTFDRTSPRKY